ncbi:olfactory receptor 1500-like [Spea bombifrons]|uniref:olfactory receptor 1500-like n=1 Tax=Spea bombifrons TaxID=233779 RepID=UPI00234A47E5|nr:olfactory receptor 1500-like [Spea bombifrons]
MDNVNITTVFLLGFQCPDTIRIILFFALLLIYGLTIAGNLLIILSTTYVRGLHCPMYVFLTQLSISDCLLTTNIVPFMLHALLHGGGTMPFTACMSQFNLFGVSEASACLLLTAMAYDRYVAICKPLHYNLIMDFTLCFKLIMVSWMLSFSLMLIETINIHKLNFCGPHVIDHFFCDFYPLLELSCSDVSRVRLEVALLCIPVIICPFIIIIISYIYIAFTILKIQSISDRQKAFSTCSSHLIVVSLFYGTLIGIYALPIRNQALLPGKLLSLLYIVVTPFLNPIVYSLRNREMKDSFTILIVYVQNTLHIEDIVSFFIR